MQRRMACLNPLTLKVGASLQSNPSMFNRAKGY